MRLWHKSLIPVLPDKQLLGQWRECCAIAKSISEKGTPNHILVNKIMNYPLDEFNTYAMFVAHEMKDRGFEVNVEKFYKYCHEINVLTKGMIFRGWHNDRYLDQCYYNLQEKFDCGGIDAADWQIIDKFYWDRKLLFNNL